MAKVDSLFTRYEFDESEESQAYIFNDLNKQHIQNEMAIAAETKSNLFPQKEDVQAERHLALEIMYYKGRMDALGELLAKDRDTRLEQQAVLQEEADNTQANHQQRS